MTYELPSKIDSIIHKLKAFYHVNGVDVYFNLLDNAKWSLTEEYTHDNWNGGQVGHALFIEVPFKLYCSIVNEKDEYQKKLVEDINKFHIYGGSDNGPNEWIDVVSVDSLPLDHVEPKVEKEAVDRIWDKGFVRAFISRRDCHKQEVSALSLALKDTGITGFVAHDSIQPTQSWLDEIENALRTMDIFIIYHKTGFHDSSYCDQEIGFAMAKGVPIITLWMDQDYYPCGFVNKLQAVKTFGKNQYELSHVVNEVVIAYPELNSRRRDAFISALCKSDSYNTTGSLITKLNQLSNFSDIETEKLISAFNENDQVRGYGGRLKTTFYDQVMNMHSQKSFHLVNYRIVER